VIERRVNNFGISEPLVYVAKSGDNNDLVVELAGVKNISDAVKQIGELPSLDFREVIENASTTASSSEAEILLGQSFVRTRLTGEFVTGAQLTFNPTTNAPEVTVKFNDEGAKIFEEITGKNIGKPLAIFLDNELIQEPVVQSKISGGEAQISGGFTVDQAKQLVERFNSGALPAPLTLIDQSTTSPVLGATALRAAIVAGLIGTLLIILFMLIYYRSLGFVAAIALIIYIAFTLALFKLIPVTLTLAGIAGFILTIGMAVDANILVFERVKEEMKKGLSRSAAMHEGFKQAWPSIRDSNSSTIITAAILYYFTSSFVRGFALTLFIGVLVSMFTAITATRLMLDVFARDKSVKGNK
jgi:protein-export membrane protein SecD